MKKTLLSALLTLSFSALPSTGMAAPKVVATIAPIQSIAAAITQGVTEPYLLIDQSSSPHATELRPSRAKQLQNADIVFWVGPNIESFLVEPLKTIASKAIATPLMASPGLTILPLRLGADWEKHGDDHDHGHEDKHDEKDHKPAAEAKHDDHDHDDHDHDKDHKNEHEAAEVDHERQDNHIWLDPQNGIAMAKAMTVMLTKADPDNSKVYQANADKLIAKLNQQQNTIMESLKSVKDSPFIVFHDAYQYFENRFGLNAIGSIMLQPGVTPGAARVKEIRSKLTALKAACLMSEPQFSDKIVPVLIEGTSTRLGSLDPIGRNLEAGPDLYPQLLQLNADNLSKCLSGK